MLKPPPRQPRFWNSNGDHPLDYTKSLVTAHFAEGKEVPLREITPAYQRAHDWEGQLVRRYRNPFAEGHYCDTCTNEWNAHGWVDHVQHKGNSISIDFVVCPGTPIEYIDKYIEAVLEARG